VPRFAELTRPPPQGRERQSAILPLIGRHGGRIIDTAGDGIMAEFPSVIGATECAVESQTVMAERNAAAPESQECAELADLEVAASDQCSSVACRGCRRAEREQGARRSHGKADGLLLVTATTLSSSTGALRRG
jgi:hypothetical protein